MKKYIVFASVIALCTLCFIAVFTIGQNSAIAKAENFNQDVNIDSIDKKNEYFNYKEKILAEIIKDSNGISDCKIDINHSNDEVVSVDVNVVTENDNTGAWETTILNYISEALGISTEDITLTFN